MFTEFRRSLATISKMFTEFRRSSVTEGTRYLILIRHGQLLLCVHYDQLCERTVGSLGSRDGRLRVYVNLRGPVPLFGLPFPDLRFRSVRVHFFEIMRCKFLVIGTPNPRDPTSDKREIQICIYLILEGGEKCA